MTSLLAALAAPAAESRPPLACLRGSKQQFLDVVTELRTLMPVGVLEALPVFGVDETAAGNALAGALNRATGS
ncbi:MAG TPA: hypothetical protein VK092_02910, partial [Deinococcales bacterium]|nr:hypothetical protein [Deinococcales bacterium]